MLGSLRIHQVKKGEPPHQVYKEAVAGAQEKGYKTGIGIDPHPGQKKGA